MKGDIRMKKIVVVLLLLAMCMAVGGAYAADTVPEKYVGTWRNIEDESHTWLIDSSGYAVLGKNGETKGFLYLTFFGETITDGAAYYYPSINAQGQLVMRPDADLKESTCTFERYEVVLPAGCELCENGFFVCTHEAGDFCRSCGNTKGGYRYSCTNCNGKGYKVCSTCGGDGVATCLGCGGSGYFSKQYGIDCSGCTRGQTTCYFCEYGRDDCYTCDNTGVLTSQYRCSSCGEALICHACYDVKDIACYQCSGAGAVAFVYNTVMRTPDSSIGKAFTFSGQIVSVENLASGVAAFVLRDDSDAIPHHYQVQYIQPEGGLRVLAGDMVNVTGYFISYDKNNTPVFVTNQLVLGE